jgi:hypothetical protein
VVNELQRSFGDPCGRPWLTVDSGATGIGLRGAGRRHSQHVAPPSPKDSAVARAGGQRERDRRERQPPNGSPAVLERRGCCRASPGQARRSSQRATRCYRTGRSARTAGDPALGASALREVPLVFGVCGPPVLVSSGRAQNAKQSPATCAVATELFSHRPPLRRRISASRTGGSEGLLPLVVVCAGWGGLRRVGSRWIERLPT